MPKNLSEKERIVLGVVQEYLNKNRYFNMKKILPFINSRFKMAKININNAGIEVKLKSLVNKNLIIEGSKLTSEDILSIPKRKQIFKFIIKNPGVYFNKIVKTLKISNHVVIWHLDMLLKFKFIKNAIFENHEIYFDPSLDFQKVILNYYLSKIKIKKILYHLKKNKKGITKTQLSKELKMHYNTVTKYFEVLEKLNAIFKNDSSRKTFYFLNNDFLNDKDVTFPSRHSGVEQQ